MVCWTVEFANFIFLLVHLNIISCSQNIHPGSHTCHITSLTGSLLGLSHDPDKTALYPIRSVQENMKLAHHHWNSTRGGHGSASMLAPNRRMTVMKSIVYLGDDLKSASLWCPRLFSAVRSVYVPGDTCQSVYVNVLFLVLICCYLFFCLFVCLFEFCKQKGAQLN